MRTGLWKYPSSKAHAFCVNGKTGTFKHALAGCRSRRITEERRFVVGNLSPLKKPSFEKCGHVPPAVGDDKDIDVRTNDSINDAVGFEEEFPEIPDPQL